MTPDKLDALADDMIEVLRAQRKALARLDVPALLDCNAKTQDLLESLGEAVSAVEGPAPALREKVLRVSIEAEATAFLVRDALEVIRGMMGIDAEPGVYDARGAVQTSDRRIVARSV